MDPETYALAREIPRITLGITGSALLVSMLSIAHKRYASALTRKHSKTPYEKTEPASETEYQPRKK